MLFVLRNNAKAIMLPLLLLLLLLALNFCPKFIRRIIIILTKFYGKNLLLIISRRGNQVFPIHFLLIPTIYRNMVVGLILSVWDYFLVQIIRRILKIARIREEKDKLMQQYNINIISNVLQAFELKLKQKFKQHLK